MHHECHLGIVSNNQKPVSQLKLESQPGTRAVLRLCPLVSKGSCMLMRVHACSCMLMRAHACSCMLMRVQLKNFERTHFPSVLHRDQACKRMHHGCQICILTAKGYNINVLSPHAWRECICLLGHCLNCIIAHLR